MSWYPQRYRSDCTKSNKFQFSYFCELSLFEVVKIVIIQGDPIFGLYSGLRSARGLSHSVKLINS